MGLLRAFIAVELPLELRQTACTATSKLRTEIGELVRWVPLENMHLTLKFLGDVAPSTMDMLSQMLRAETELFNCFDLRLNGLGSFPSSKRPRVIYIGIQAPPALESLQRGIESTSRR